MRVIKLAATLALALALALPLAACGGGAAPPSIRTTLDPQPGACFVQDGQRLANPPVRATGTEPFWLARVDGRCIDYAHPEDPNGTRIVTRYTRGANGGGTWAGELHGQPFALVIRSAPGCSDGMSDRRYLYDAELLVRGEQRRGCAEQHRSAQAPQPVAGASQARSGNGAAC